MKIIPHLFLRLWLFANAFKCDCITPNDEQFTNYPVEVISSETFGLIHNKDLSYRRINMHEIDKTVSQSQCYEFCMKNCVWHCSIAFLTSFYVISTWKWAEHIIGYTHMAKNYLLDKDNTHLHNFDGKNDGCPNVCICLFWTSLKAPLFKRFKKCV